MGSLQEVGRGTLPGLDRGATRVYGQRHKERLLKTV